MFDRISPNDRHFGSMMEPARELPLAMLAARVYYSVEMEIHGCKELFMSEIGIRGIDLFKIANESISGWIPSWKMGGQKPSRQPFCSLMEERLLMFLEYHPQVVWYGRGDIRSEEHT